MEYCEKLKADLDKPSDLKKKDKQVWRLKEKKDLAPWKV